MYSNIDEVLKKLDCLIYIANVANGFWISEYAGVPIEIFTGHKEKNFLSGKMDWFDIIHTEDQATVTASLNNLNRFPADLTLQYRIVHKDGTSFWVRDVKKVTKKNNKLTARGIIMNISEHKKLEVENDKLLFDLIAKNNELQEAIDSISKVNVLMRSNSRILEETAQLKINKAIIPQIESLKNLENTLLINEINAQLKSLFDKESNEDIFGVLSKREVQIAIFVKDGLTQREIAQECKLSLDTVKTHVKNIKKKLNISKKESLLERLSSN